MIRNIARSVSKQRTLRLSSKLCLQCSNTTRYFSNLTKNEQISTLDQFLDSSPANDRIQNTNTTENLYKNIYKEIGYKSPFSNIENSLILKKLNEAKSEEELCLITAKPKASILFDHLQKHGVFNCVEELLSVKKFDEKVIERLGKKIIKIGGRNEEDSDSSSKIEAKEHTRIKLKYSKLMKNIRPRIKGEHYFSNDVQSIVGIKLSFYNFSYIHMDKNSKKILDWKTIDSFESKELTQHPKLYENIIRLVGQIPKADLYVIEEQLPILRNKVDSYFATKVNLLELQSALISILNIRKYQSIPSNQCDADEDDDIIENCVYLMKQSVIDGIFDLKIGTERVGIQNKFFGENNCIFGENPHRAFLDFGFQEDSKQVMENFNTYSKYGKEHLATTLMMVAGLHDIISTCCSLDS